VLHGIIFLGAVSVIHRKLDRHTHLGGGSGRIVAQAACVFAVFQKDGKVQSDQVTRRPVQVASRDGFTRL
ncbi:MAG: hypothetical protein V1792_13210, partial [Pseudomonadota bacterium]